MLNQIKTDLDSPHIRSYATRENLMKRIDAEPSSPDHCDRYLVVRTPKGRWTAIIILDKSTGGYIGRYQGFLKA